MKQKHLTENQIASFIDNKLDASERLSIIEHIVQCDKCYDELLETYTILKNKNEESELQLDKRIRKEALSLGLKTSGGPGSLNFNFRKNRIKFSFGLILTAIVIVVIFNLNRNENRKQFRDSRANLVLNVITPQESASIDESMLLFEWEKLENVLTYRIKVYNELGNVLVDTSIERNSINLTGKINISKSSKYFWDVGAVYNNGQVITSRLNAFTIK